uniref:CSON009900 protein n=1 Tax=Culicoides sonorensis TaxID=179676 RepID=A0A336KL31_CULSO
MLLIFQSNNPAPIIILQDMTPHGFKTFEGLVELESVKVITEKLAKFHACSMILEENGTTIQNMTGTYFQPIPEKVNYCDEYVVPGVVLAIEEIQTWGGCEEIVLKLKKCMETFSNQIVKIHTEPHGKFNKVLNHGDFHFKNLLYRNEGTKADDILLIDFHKDELILPEWLNKEYFENVLKSYKKCETVKIIDLITSPGTAPGEHFASIMFRVNLTYQCDVNENEEQSKFILKTVPIEEGVKMDFLKDSTAFPTEMRMYGEILPKMQKLLHDVGDTTIFAPELIFQSNDPAPIIILKDMTPHGYKTYEISVELEGVKVITEKVAKFHACSLILQENGTNIQNMTGTYFQPIPGKMNYCEEHIVPGVVLAIEELQTWDGCEEIVVKLKKCLETFANDLVKIHTEPQGLFHKVLNHGDIHFKNLLYRNDGTKADDVLLIDFQYSLYNNPIIDIVNLLHAVGSRKVCENHKDDVIKFYYTTLSSTLKLLKFKGELPKLEVLYQDLLRLGVLEVMMVVCYSAYFFLDWSEIDFNELMEDKDMYRPVKDVWKNNEIFKHEFFENVLRKQHCDQSITVTNITLEAALGKGENYASDIIRAKIQFKAGLENTRSAQYIVKAGMADTSMQDMLEEYDVFHREIVVYDKILPVVESLLLSIKDKTKLAPSVYSLGKSPRHFVFEDLTLSGYEKANRRQGLNYTETRIMLQQLAKFHAATAVLHTLDPESMKDHHFPNIGPDQTYFYPLFTNAMKSCAQQASKWPGCEKFADKLFKLEPYLIEKAFDIYTWNENDFNVLTHGDAWLSNALFKYDKDTKEAIDCILMDFSVGYFGSPGIDLVYLLFGSTSCDLKEREFDLLVQEYHLELISVLKKLHYKRTMPSLRDLHIEMLKKGLLGVMYSTFLIPIRLLEDVANADLTNLLGMTEESNKFRQMLFSNPGYQERMSYLLDYYDRKGILSKTQLKKK